MLVRTEASLGGRKRSSQTDTWKLPRIESPTQEMKPKTMLAVLTHPWFPKSLTCWKRITTIHRPEGDTGTHFRNSRQYKGTNNGIEIQLSLPKTEKVLQIWEKRQLWGLYEPHVLIGEGKNKSSNIKFISKLNYELEHEVHSAAECQVKSIKLL